LKSGRKCIYNYNEKQELLNSFQKLIFGQRSAARGPRPSGPPLATPLYITAWFSKEQISRRSKYSIPRLLNPRMTCFGQCWTLILTIRFSCPTLAQGWQIDLFQATFQKLGLVSSWLA